MSTTWTFEQLLDHMRSGCGIRPGQTLIIHSSAHAIGDVEGGIVTLVKLIKEAVTEEGTLLLPVFSNPPKNGIFKIKRTPSRVGLLTEAFRRSADVKRSQHPTHSVAAWGKRRDEFLAGHEKTSGLGVDSPFHKAAKAGADILMIGCDLTTCSLVHVGEAIVRAPYLGKVAYPSYDRTLTLIDYEGNEHQVPPIDLPGDSAAFTRVQDEMENRGQIEHCRVGDAETLKFDAMDCLNTTVEMLRENPGVLLCDKKRCAVCSESKQYL
jgi:aminoglycoside 3-N-acetyltransferase